MKLGVLLLRYEKEGKARKTIKAQTLWFAVLDAQVRRQAAAQPDIRMPNMLTPVGLRPGWVCQVETGTPYMLFKDHCNRKSNQQNLGTIKSSNLCTEIVEYTAPDEVRLHVTPAPSIPIHPSSTTHSSTMPMCRWQCATWRR